MEYNGYILNKDGLVIDDNQLVEIKEILDNCNSDAIFFNTISQNKVEGLSASAFDLQREQFITLNECTTFSTPTLYGFVKKEFYNGENSLMNVYNNENIKFVSMFNVVLGNRDTVMPKSIEAFIKEKLPQKVQEFYFPNTNEKIVKNTVQNSNILIKVLRKVKRTLKKWKKRD